MTTLLTIKQLDFDYGDFPLLKNMNTHVNAGEILHVQGENGAGKTTFLRLLATFLTPTRGEIQYQNVSIERMKEAYQHQVTYIGHRSGVHGLLTPREYAHFEFPEQTKEHLQEALHFLALTSIEDMPCWQLSEGQRKRVSFLRLISAQKLIWLLDEPWVSLDAFGVQVLNRLIEAHVVQGGCVVCTSHQPLSLSSERIRRCTLS